MKRILYFILSLFLAFNFATVNAQKNIFIWKNGALDVKSDVNSFSFESNLLQIKTSAATSVTTNSISASARISFVQNVKKIILPEYVVPEVGVCISSAKTPVYLEDACLFLGSDIKDYDDFTIEGLSPGTTYIYRVYVRLGNKVLYGNVQSVTTFGEKEDATSSFVMVNGQCFVDLGLPSGTLWARSNVGAVSTSGRGNLFSWGETVPQSYYACCNNGNDDSKYSEPYKVSNLQPEDDAATVVLGKGCYMPSYKDFQELYDKCIWSWCSNEGAEGYLVTGPNGKSIFLPLAGHRIDDDGSSDEFGNGYYWSRSVGWRDCHATSLCFSKDDITINSMQFRHYGFAIRPITKKQMPISKQSINRPAVNKKVVPKQVNKTKSRR